jgi:hypothetical protein
MGKKENCLDEKTRAEDILLGSLGFDSEAKIIEVKLTAQGYQGRGRWSDDNETFDFQSEEEADELEKWAVGVLNGK